MIKTLLTINRLLRSQAATQQPDIVAELFDPLKVDIAQGTMEPPPEIVVSDVIIARLIAHSIRCRRLAQILLQILSHRHHNSLYVRGFPEFAGASPAALHEIFPKAIVLGALRRDGTQLQPHLNPSCDFRLEADDQLVFLAMRYDDCVPACPPGWRPRLPSRVRAPIAEVRTEASKRILVLGWSYKIGALIAALGGYDRARCELTVMSRMPIDERERWLTRIASTTPCVEVRHIEGDYTLRQNLEQIDLMRFGHIVLLASGWRNSPEESDARAVLGYVLLTSMLKEKDHAPEIVVEFLASENSRLLSAHHHVFLISPLLLSHMMAHVALRRELNGVFNALFGAEAVHLQLRYPSDYGLAEQSLTFNDIQRVVIDHGDIALGLLRADHRQALRSHLNPDREDVWTLRSTDELLVLTRCHDETSPSCQDAV